MIRFDDIHFSYSGKPVLAGASAALPAGAKVALVGPNGAGKSTLLKLIDGSLPAQQGDIDIPERTRLQRLDQAIPEPSLTVLETVIRADATLYALRRKAADPDLPDMEKAEVHSQLFERGDSAADAKASALLSGLGFAQEELAQPISAFSGGWQMRAALAGLLFTEPDYLLLDEPTNYLDLEGALWLESYLARYPRGWVLISHERTFLDNAPSHILHMAGGKTSLYTGNYTVFLRQWNAQKMQSERASAKLAAKRAHMEAFVERFRAKASKAKQAQSRLKALEKLGDVDVLAEEKAIAFSLPDITPLPPPILTLEDVTVGYDPASPVLTRLNLRLDQDDRIALLGPNGRGKSTFAKLIAGQLSAQGGEVTRNSKLRIGFFTQHQVDVLAGGRTPLAHLAEVLPDLAPTQLRARLAQFGFDAEMAGRAAQTLSGGQRARLLLALICAHDPQLLLLDEPTNHLDIASRQILAQALARYQGAVIMISHDRALIDQCADRLWIIEDNTIRRFDGTLDDYQAQVLGQTKSDASKDMDGEGNDRKRRRQNAAQKRQALAPLKKAAAHQEKAMERCAAEVEKLKTTLANPDLYAPENKAKAVALQKSIGEAEAKLEAAEAAWMDAQEAYEAAMAEAE